ncbi:MAG TPA: hypothetical protein EYN66_09640 [Myxococcales bacterium]|nr:hypothetical protein [Myxococcales bacterium]
MERSLVVTGCTVLLFLSLLLSAGCKDTSQTEAQKASSTEKKASVAPQLEKAPAASVPDRERLAAVFSGMWCINKQRDRSGMAKLLALHKFKDAAQWAAQWSQLSTSDPKWTEETMVRVINTGCK